MSDYFADDVLVNKLGIVFQGVTLASVNSGYLE